VWLRRSSSCELSSFFWTWVTIEAIDNASERLRVLGNDPERVEVALNVQVVVSRAASGLR